MGPHYFCRTFRNVAATDIEKTFETAEQAAPGALLLRMVFFTDAVTAEMYTAQAERIARAVGLRFASRPPVWSLVAQAPVGGGMAAEAHYYVLSPGQQVSYKGYAGIPYVMIEGGGVRELFLSAGGHNMSLPADVPAQSRPVFAAVADVMRHEGMAADTIQRQWNYVDGITLSTGCCQHYQSMNDARSDFYATVPWPGGYPAASGIGADAGGILVEVNAAYALRSHAVDNPLQRAAHVYTRRVLLAGDHAQPSTPKFERARVVEYPWGALGYISGTAAIRREDSLADMDAADQTRATLENIDALLAQMPGSRVDSARVYLKTLASYEAVRPVVESHYPDAQILYLKAEVCRPELLVEIEALASSGK